MATKESTPGNDVLSGTASDDSFDGGSGIDTVKYDGKRAEFTISYENANYTITDNSGLEGKDILKNIERLQFGDANVAIDLLPNQAGGMALEFIGVLAPNLISNPAIVGTILRYFDQGHTLSSLSQLAIDVGLIRNLAGSASNADLARMAFRNVVGSEADANVTDLLVSYMDGRNASFSQSEFIATIAGLELNQKHIKLVGFQEMGLEFV